jgi:hypothetical protein
MNPDHRTLPLAVPGTACAMCADPHTPRLNVPVVGYDGVPRFPGLCRSCLSMTLKLAHQMLGTLAAGDEVADLVIRVQSGT